MSFCVGAPVVSAGPVQPVDSAGKPRCALCPTRLSRCKGKLHTHEKGRICQGCYDSTRRPASTQPQPSTPCRSHKLSGKRKRTESDPGQPQNQNLSRLRTRAPRPAIIPPVKKARFKVDPVDISALLDQTHARRMALIEAEKSGTHSTHASTVNASTLAWDGEQV
jgi:hypothetical protein